MKKFFERLFFSILLLVVTGFAMPTSALAADLKISNARMELPGEDSVTASAYVTLENTSDNEIILIKVRSAAFDLGMIQQSVNDRGDMRAMLKSELIIKPKTTVKMGKKGVHLMFAGPKTKLKRGKTVKVDLYLNTGERLPVEFKLVK